jgi:hypothetical protein
MASLLNDSEKLWGFLVLKWNLLDNDVRYPEKKFVYEGNGNFL